MPPMLTQSRLESERADQVRAQSDEHGDGNGDLEPYEPHRLAELGGGDQVISFHWVVAGHLDESLACRSLWLFGCEMLEHDI